MSDEWLPGGWGGRKIESGDRFTRPTAGGGYGDPMERDPEHVRQDVIDEYVSVKRPELDYGVVIKLSDADMLD